MTLSSRKVCVVGAGVSGLASARELRREGHDVTVMEQSRGVGGQWLYDPTTDGGDPLGTAGAQSSVYASLRLNFPRELAGFSDFPFYPQNNGDARRYPGHGEFLRYIRDFCDAFGLTDAVRLNTKVLHFGMAPRDGDGCLRWLVRCSQKGEGEGEVVTEEVFDAVVVCNGHCSMPLVPKIQGISKWRGKQMHSHNYRTPAPFQDENVVVVGFGASGVDIATEISHVAKEVHIASRGTQHKLGKIESYKNAWMHAEVYCVQDDGKVRFADGSTVDADTILYCTGYRYHFPFIDLDGFTVDDNRVGPLYKHVFPPKYAPNLSFIGVPIRNILFQTYELQSKWVAGVLSGPGAALPSEEDMLASVREDYRRMEEAGRQKRHTHVLMPEWVEHMNWLTDQVGEPHVEPQRRDVYDKALMRVLSLDEGYRDRWEEEGGAATAPEEDSATS